MLNKNYWNQVSRQWIYLPLLFICILSTGETKAATFDLSYTLSTGSQLDVDLQGILQADNNSVIITDIDAVEFDGVSFTSQINFFDSISHLSDPTIGLPPVLSLDGTVLDFIACFTMACNDGFAFFADDFNPPAYLGGLSFGLTQSLVVNNQNYSLVPEPYTLPLLLLGLMIMGRKYQS